MSADLPAPLTHPGSRSSLYGLRVGPLSALQAANAGWGQFWRARWGQSGLTHSSGQQERHRLNRGGDRQANSALWKIVLTRMVCDPRTSAYIERRRKEGLTKKEAIRCLKRYIAREVYNYLPRADLALDSP